ncbi:MAG: ABC transporter permease [Candidatus Aminicenantes bacterium]|nr:ABC transporter permease [Candidatus Aminicenantes bacterium]
MAVVFFLEKDLSPAARTNVLERIRSSPPVEQVRFVSPEDALKRFRERFPQLQDVVSDLGTNPFPASVEVVLKDKTASSPDTLQFMNSLRDFPGVEDVQFNRDWVEKMKSLSRLARAVGYFLGGILILASFFTISNVIRLNVFARRNEIEILRFVGATNTFIRMPFVIEGMALGILGSLLSLALIYGVIRVFPLYLGASLGALQDIVNFRFLTLGQSLSLVFGGALMGLLGSLSSLSRFLKI